LKSSKAISDERKWLRTEAELQQILMDAPGMRENFEERAYLNANPDVRTKAETLV